MAMSRVMTSVALSIQVTTVIPGRSVVSPVIGANHLSPRGITDTGVLANLPRWTISSKPMLTIREDDPDREFILVTAIERLPNGDYLIADHDRNQVKRFDASGKYLKTHTRVGDGPGEFRGLSWISHVDARLYFGDSYSLSEFLLDGTFVRRLLVPLVLHPLGRLAGGATAVQNFEGTNNSYPGTQNRLISNGTVNYGMVSKDSGGTIRWFPPLERQFMAWYLEGDQYPSMSHDSPFTPEPCQAVSGKYFWVGHGGNRKITLYNGQGRPERTVMFPLAPRPFDEAAIKVVRDREVAGQSKPIDKRYAEFRYGEKFRPKTAPLFSRFVAGADGDVWIELYREDRLARARFVVLGPDGKPRAVVDGPGSAVKILKIGPEYVAGAMKDDDGIPFVVIYSLQRSR